MQLNLHKICQSLPNLQSLKIDMPANYTKDQVGHTSVVYQRDLDLEPTSADGEQVFLRKSRLEKIAIAGLDQVRLLHQARQLDTFFAIKRWCRNIDTFEVFP